MALILQCGITVAAAVVVIFTPPVGLGCRSLGYILYGINAIVIMFFNIISTILVRFSETRTKSSTIKDFTAFAAIILRRSSLLFAFANAVGFVVLSFLLFSGFLNNCYCLTGVIGRGSDAYIVVATYEGWTSMMRASRIAATILAATCMAIYMIFLRLMTRLPEKFLADGLDH